MERRIRVLVTGVSGGAVGEQIMKALLMTKKYDVIGIDSSEICAGFYRTYFPCKVVPSARDNPKEYLDALTSISKDVYKAIFFGSEPEIALVNKHRYLFSHVYLAINNSYVIETCMNKLASTKFLELYEFDCPETVLVTNSEELKKVDFFPVVLKPGESTSGSRNVFIAQNKKELEIFGNFLLTHLPYILAQEYVGTPDDEYTVGVLSDPEKNIIGSIAMHRIITSGLGSKFSVPNITGRKELGKSLFISSGISQGKIISRSEINEKCEDIAKKLGSTGPLNIQCRFVNGKLYPFEINPRLSGTTSSRAVMGYNEPDMLIDMCVHKKKIVAPTYSTGYVMRTIEEVYMGGIK